MPGLNQLVVNLLELIKKFVYLTLLVLGQLTEATPSSQTILSFRVRISSDLARSYIILLCVR